MSTHHLTALKFKRRQSRMEKSESVLEVLPYQKRFTDSAPSVNRYKFRAGAFIEFLQNAPFGLSSYDVFHDYFVYFAINIQKPTVLAK